MLETAEITTDEAETIVARQAKAFETEKPYLVERWRGADALTARQPLAAAAGA